MSERTDAEITAHLVAETRRLVGLIHVLTGDRELSDELFQETCLQVWKSRERFDQGRDLGHWVRGIARKVVLRYFRSAQRRSSAPLSEEVMNLLVDEREAVNSEIENHDVRAPALRACMDELLPDQRSLLGRFYGEGWSQARLASEVGKTQDAVKLLLFRLRQKLQKCVSSRLLREQTHG